MNSIINSQQSVPQHKKSHNQAINPNLARNVETLRETLSKNLNAIKDVLSDLSQKEDSKSQELHDYICKQSWQEILSDNLQTLDRIKDRNLTPVTFGIMGRMSAGKTTILREIISATANSPVNYMPERKDETTACAVRWTNSSRFAEIYDIADNHLLLKTFPDQDGQALELQIDLSMSEEDGESTVPGLESTAHPDDLHDYHLMPQGNGTYTVINHKVEGHESLADLATKSRIAIIGTESAMMKVSNEEQAFLSSLDIVDNPGADAVNGRSEFVDKANKVFESNTHEADILMLVIGTEPQEINLGKHIQENNSVRWALRCILSGQDKLKYKLVKSLINTYRTEASDEALIKFIYMDEEQEQRNYQQDHAAYLLDKFCDDDRFWHWLDKRRKQMSAEDYDLFKQSILSVIKKDGSFTTEIIKGGRLSFIINKSFELLNGQQGFTEGPKQSFWVNFVNTTLNGVPGSLDAFRNGVWPKFFMMDWDNGLKNIDSFFEDELSTFKKKLSAVKKLFSPHCPVSLGEASSDEKATKALKSWCRKLGESSQIDFKMIKDEIKKKKATKAYKEHVHQCQLAQRIHDFAQSWWWSREFVALPNTTKRELYEWTIDSAMHLFYREPTGISALGGAQFVREHMMLDSQGEVLNIKNDELDAKFTKVQQSYENFLEQMNVGDQDDQHRKQIEEWISEINTWSYWESGHGVIINKSILSKIEGISTSADSDSDKAIQDLIELSCEVAIKQMSGQEQQNHSLKPFIAWVTEVIRNDATINLFAEVQLRHKEYTKEKRCKEFARAVLMRTGVLVNKLRRSASDSAFIKMCIKSHTQNPILSEVVELIRSYH